MMPKFREQDVTKRVSCTTVIILYDVLFSGVVKIQIEAIGF